MEKCHLVVFWKTKMTIFQQVLSVSYRLILASLLSIHKLNGCNTQSQILAN